MQEVRKEGSCFVMFIDWHLGVVSAVSGCSTNTFRQILGAGLAPLLHAKEGKSRFGSSGLSDGGICHFAVRFLGKRTSVRAKSPVSNHSVLPECLISHSLTNAPRASLLWLLNY